MNTPKKNFELKPLIYSYFNLVPNEEPYVGNTEWSTWQCKSDWCQKKVAIRGSTNSNLKTHLNSAKHKNEKEDYDNKSAESFKQVTPGLKRHRECDSPAKSLLEMGVSKNVTPAKLKFNKNHPRQIECTKKLTNLLVKCCLPLSLVEQDGFQEYTHCLEENFQLPCRNTMKHSILPVKKKEVEAKLNNELKQIEFVNISLDGWSDKIMRSFNGYIAQGINNDWQMKIFVIAFEHMTGRHTSENIKKQYDLIVDRFNLSNKMFKVVADQAANMKKAHGEEKESVNIADGANEDNIQNLTQLLVERRKKYDLIESKKQQKEVDKLNESIEEFNKIKINDDQPKINSFMKRDQVLLDLDELTEELSIEEDQIDEKESDDTDEDVDSDLISIPVDIADLRLTFNSYLPCCAHAAQLVLKDGIQLDEEYTQLIKKVSKDIVSKTKVSNLIAEEVRKLEKILSTYVITRWNSILFMISSVLRLSDEDFKTIRKSMPNRTQKHKDI